MPNRDGINLRASYHGPWQVRLLLVLLVVIVGLTAIVLATEFHFG